MALHRSDAGLNRLASRWVWHSCFFKRGARQAEDFAPKHRPQETSADGFVHNQFQSSSHVDTSEFS